MISVLKLAEDILGKNIWDSVPLWCKKGRQVLHKLNTGSWNSLYKSNKLEGVDFHRSQKSSTELS